VKKYCIFLWVSLFFISCDTVNKDKTAADPASQTTIATTDSTTVQIIDSSYNFGKVSDGEKVEFSYRFKNTGTKPLVIEDASASCGCTVPQKPEKPIMPGETGFIKIVFDSKGRVGNAYKTVTVRSNAKPEFPQLILTGDVKAKKE
jgi:hypothetical protein